MRRLTVRIDDREHQALLGLARSERLDPSAQATLLIVEALVAREFLDESNLNERNDPDRDKSSA